MSALVIPLQPPRFGASPEDWNHFDLALGLSADLLPVVSNPQAEISPDSKMKELGKTPSRYNKDGKAVGIPGWTGHIASDQDVGRWMKESDYGICLQTRVVRALDVDVVERDEAEAIRKFMGEHLSYTLPRRYRSNSHKFLAAFTLPGEMAKRKIVVKGGIIEFLATGQQFVAVGTHPSGVRYEWAGGLPNEFPELALEEFEALWSALVERFAIEAPMGFSSGLSVRKKGDYLEKLDPVADYLDEMGLVLGEDREGSLLVVCPWDHEHTTGEAGDGSTVWFPAGTNGYDKGHFKCLHGHCEGRTDGDFFAAVGYVEDVAGEFEVIEHKAEEGAKPLPAFKRDGKGRIEATIGNVAMAVARPDFCGIQIGFDQFRDEIMYCAPGSSQWRPFLDADYSRLRITLEKRSFKPIGRELVRDSVLLVADENRFDSAIVWLEGLKWDGVPRVETFLQVFFQAAESPYVRAVSRYLWTAMAGRVMQPGVKADMVPILIGKQGKGKSSAVAAMAPAPEFFTEISFNEKDEDLARKMRGRLVAEIGELRGLHTKELEAIKAFITRTHENWIPKYREFAVQFPRRLVFVGTTNKDQFLADETGNRRWLPVPVGKVDLDAIRALRDQLWAEGRERFKAMGIEYQDAEQLAEGVHEAHTITEPWVETVEKWLDEPDDLSGSTPREREFLTVSDVLQEALRFDAKQIGKREEMRVCNVLRACGYERAFRWVCGKNIRVWTCDLTT